VASIVAQASLALTRLNAEGKTPVTSGFHRLGRSTRFLNGPGHIRTNRELPGVASQNAVRSSLQASDFPFICTGLALLTARLKLIASLPGIPSLNAIDFFDGAAGIRALAAVAESYQFSTGAVS
jgi:hypothetical protein